MRHARTLAKEAGSAEALKRVKVVTAQGDPENDYLYNQTVRDNPKLTICDLAELDISSRYIGAPNGVVDMNTGRVLREEEGRRHRVTRSLPDNYDDSATHPMAAKALNHPTLDAEQWAYLLHWFGMCMRGQPYIAKVGLTFFDDNVGDTGKSALLECIELAIGEYAGPVDQGVVRKDPRRGKNDHSTSKVAMVGLRIGWVEEADEITIDTPEWRNLIGNRTFTARDLYQATTTYVNTCGLLLVGNGPPRIDLSSTPAFRRYRPIQARAIALRHQEIGLRDAFAKAADSEADRDHARARQALAAGIIRLAREEFGFSEADLPESMAELRKQHRDASIGEAGVWIQDNMERKAAGFVTTASLWHAFVEAMGKSYVKAAAEENTNGTEPEPQPKIAGYNRQGFNRLASKLFKSTTREQRNRVTGKKERGWVGWGFTVADQSEALDGDQSAAMDDTYCAAPLADGQPCGEPLNAVGQCDVADTHAAAGPPAPGVGGGDSGTRAVADVAAAAAGEAVVGGDQNEAGRAHGDEDAGRTSAHGVGRRVESGGGARDAPGRRARRHSDAVARLPAGRRGQARAGHRGNGGRLPNRRVGRLAVGSARSGRDDRGGRAAAEARPRRAAGPRGEPVGLPAAEVVEVAARRVTMNDDDRHDVAACTDATCRWCDGYGDGYAAGKDKTHEELRGGGWRQHVACCGCESCRTVKLIAAGRIS